MKRIIVFVLFLFVYNFIYSEENKSAYVGTFTLLNDKNEKGALAAELIFKNKEYIFRIDGVNSINWFVKQYKKYIKNNYYFEIRGKYNIKNDSEMKLIDFENRNSPLYGTFEIFSCEGVLFLLNKSGIIFQSQDPILSKPQLPFIYTVSSSSFLEEKKKSYDGSSFKYSLLGFTPWCEAASDYGKGEWIEIEISSEVDIKSILFLNGFIDFNRVDLYKKNNRIKLIDIKINDETYGKVFELEDTRNLQKIELPFPVKASDKIKIRFTIVDVYPGEQWNDTCISRVIPWFE